MNSDRIARAYRWMEYLTFGTALQKRRSEFLDQISCARDILVLGDGDGRFTAELLHCNGEACVDSVELSGKMSALAAKRIKQSSEGPRRTRQIKADVRAVTLTRKYDLVVAHFFLDCFTAADLAALIPSINTHLRPGGRWLISEFQLPSGGLWRWIAAAIIKGLYVSFRLLTGLKTSWLPDYPTILKSDGFRLILRKEAVRGLLVSELWERAAIASS